MPKFDRASCCLIWPIISERSFRTNYSVSDFTTEECRQPHTGQTGVLVRYAYTLPNDELVRRGEARLTVAKGKLYVINFKCAELH